MMSNRKYLANNRFIFAWMTIRNSQLDNIDNHYIMISQRERSNKSVNGNKNIYKSLGSIPNNFKNQINRILSPHHNHLKRCHHLMYKSMCKNLKAQFTNKNMQLIIDQLQKVIKDQNTQTHLLQLQTKIKIDSFKQHIATLKAIVYLRKSNQKEKSTENNYIDKDLRVA